MGLEAVAHADDSEDGAVSIRVISQDLRRLRKFSVIRIQQVRGKEKVNVGKCTFRASVMQDSRMHGL